MKGVLCTVISFCPDGYVFQPSKAAVLEELNNSTIEGIIALAHAAPRLLHMRMFAQHFDVGGRPSPGWLSAWLRCPGGWMANRRSTAGPVVHCRVACLARQ